MTHVTSPPPAAPPLDSRLDPTYDASLEEEFYESEKQLRHRRYPWLLMLDTLRVALDPRKLVLAVLAVLLVAGGMRAIDRLPFAAASEFDPTALSTPERRVLSMLPRPIRDIAATAAVPELGLSPGALTFAPLAQVDRPLVALLAPGSSWSRVADLMLRFVWTLAVWAFLGGAIARMAALRLAGDHPTGTLAALKYSAKSLASSIGGPLTPLAAVLVLWGLCSLVGLVARIPGVGEVIAAVLFIGVIVLAGFALFVLLGVLLAWPLMVATLSIEGTDAFDGLSRGFGYLYGRVFYFVFLAALMFVLGLVGAWVAAVAVNLIELLALRFLSPGLPPGQGLESATAERLFAFWTGSLETLGYAYPVSYFWTATAAIYLLMRRSFDGTAVDEVWIPPEESGDDLLPLVGEPAANRREEAAKPSAVGSESSNAKPAEAKPADEPKQAIPAGPTEPEAKSQSESAD